MDSINTRPDDTRERILRIALDLFAKHGFDGVSIRQISSLAECNVASLNYHFGTKKNLYIECLSLMEPEIYGRLKKILERPSNKNEFEERFLKFCTVFAEFTIKNASALKLLINELNSETGAPTGDTFLKPINDLFENYLKDAQAIRMISGKIDTTIITRMILAIIVSQKLFKSFKPYEDITDTELAKKIVESCTTSFYLNE